MDMSRSRGMGKDLVDEAMYAVDPVLEVILALRGIVSRLRRSSRESILAVRSAGDMN